MCVTGAILPGEIPPSFLAILSVSSVSSPFHGGPLQVLQGTIPGRQGYRRVLNALAESSGGSSCASRAKQAAWRDGLASLCCGAYSTPLDTREGLH